MIFYSDLTCFLYPLKASIFAWYQLKQTDLNGQVELADFGYLKLIEGTGKILEGEYATIIQHPNGKPKQIAIFDSEILSKASPDFLLYKTDTIGGSSGSPVFSADWLVVALHHAGVPTQAFIDSLPADGADEFQLIKDNNANEGIRVSAILKKLKEINPACYNFISQAAKVEIQKSLPQRVFHYARPNSDSSLDISTRQTSAEVESIVQSENTPNIMKTTSNSIFVNIPLEIRLGRPQGSLFVDPEGVDLEEEELEKKKKKKPQKQQDKATNPGNREGFDSAFVAGVELDLAQLCKPYFEKKLLAPLKESDDHELKYTHFSVIMHKVKRMCLVAAVNIDGADTVNVDRGGDNWLIDSRMDSKYQLGNDIYYNNDLDRGHMVRRMDPNWGPDAAQANDDTFFYHQCLPSTQRLKSKNLVVFGRLCFEKYGC